MRQRIVVFGVILTLLGGCAPQSRPTAPSPFAVADTAFVIMGYERLEPTILHEAISVMVLGCIVAWAETRPEVREGLTRLPEIMWGAADTIAGLPTRHLAYGVSGVNDDGLGFATIENDFWLNPGVLSHEIAHLVGVREDSFLMERCVMPIGVGLPMRWVDEETMKSLIERGRIVRRRRR